jgi:hypothetical protein
MLAASLRGRMESVMEAHGVAIGTLRGLVRAGLATADRGPAYFNPSAIVTMLQITEAGRRALAYRKSPARRAGPLRRAGEPRTVHLTAEIVPDGKGWGHAGAGPRMQLIIAAASNCSSSAGHGAGKDKGRYDQRPHRSSPRIA